MNEEHYACIQLKYLSDFDKDLKDLNVTSEANPEYSWLENALPQVGLRRSILELVGIYPTICYYSSKKYFIRV